jgi:hypothetical protein
MGGKQNREHSKNVLIMLILFLEKERDRDEAISLLSLSQQGYCLSELMKSNLFENQGSQK